MQGVQTTTGETFREEETETEAATETGSEVSETLSAGTLQGVQTTTGETSREEETETEAATETETEVSETLSVGTPQDGQPISGETSQEEKSLESASVPETEETQEVSSGRNWVFPVIIIALLALILLFLWLWRRKKRKADQSVEEMQIKPDPAGAKKHVRIEKEPVLQQMEVQLWISNGAAQAEKMDLCINGSCIIGRSNLCEVYCDDPMMSKQHFVLEVDEGNLFVTDLESMNGTMVNGVRISGRYRLQPSDEIEAGNLRFRLEWRP